MPLGMEYFMFVCLCIVLFVVLVYGPTWFESSEMNDPNE